MSQIRARIANREGSHEIELNTNERSHRLEIASGPSGRGSAVNGGELLFLALATCYCNDIYREASKVGVVVRKVDVEVVGSFPQEGAAAEAISYSVTVEADGTEEEIRALMRHTDTVSEIQNTVRQAVPVSLSGVTAVSTKRSSS